MESYTYLITHNSARPIPLVEDDMTSFVAGGGPAGNGRRDSCACALGAKVLLVEATVSGLCAWSDLTPGPRQQDFGPDGRPCGAHAGRLRFTWLETDRDMHACSRLSPPLSPAGPEARPQYWVDAHLQKTAGIFPLRPGRASSGPARRTYYLAPRPGVEIRYFFHFRSS